MLMAAQRWDVRLWSGAAAGKLVLMVLAAAVLQACRVVEQARDRQLGGKPHVRVYVVESSKPLMASWECCGV